MNRRDFLSLRATRPGETLELSGRALYLHYLDAQSPQSMQTHPTAETHEPWMGEPPAQFVQPSVDDILGQVERDLQRVHRLRILDGEWLASTDLGERLAPLLASFRARGGYVEILTAND